MASLLSLNVGLSREVDWRGRTVRTGIWKHPVDGPRLVRRLNIDGDGQGDLAGHGGEHRAVLVYQAQAYRYWRAQLGWGELEFGSFGENLTVDGLADDEVCVGDRYRIGEAEFEVTQPRVTCFRLGIRLDEPQMAALLVAHHRPGFYMRVLTEGRVQAGDEIVKIADGPQRLTVADVDALLYLPDHPAAKLRRALRIPALSAGWRSSFRDLLEAAENPDRGSGSATDTQPGWAGFRPLQVREVVKESVSVVSIILDDPDGAVLPTARPGQYLTARVPEAGRPAPVRSYSLSSAPGASRYRISVKREAHGLVSGYLHDSLKPGSTIEAAAPRGNFVLQDGTAPVVLISAGIGVTPVLSMLHALAKAGGPREVWWLHSARNPAEHAFAAETLDLLAGLDGARRFFFYSEATPDEAAATGAARGRLTAEMLTGLALPTGAAAYLCGPPAFMADIRNALNSLGVSDVHTELFGPQDAVNPGVVAKPPVAPHVPAGPPGPGPPVTFSRSGLTAPFDGAGFANLLEFAEACDVPTRWACRTGVCHTCTTPLLSGTVCYEPAPLEMPAEGSVLICCARPTSDLVLDM
ncbi:MAG TPA: MOSC and FAD-binding oxidoreductase domain-containing protein [Sporichthyaceae bacterium]|jgi:ferredoxin-NADP reductase/MOSC domain-containing protein YiiM|nr:MOSC and FAD-binding oxidoreductase domain-containing protein [Sporichthyaceae bacterium]